MDTVYTAQFTVSTEGYEDDTDTAGVAVGRSMLSDSINAMHVCVDEELLPAGMFVAMHRKARTLRGEVVESTTQEVVYLYEFAITPIPLPGGIEVHFRATCREDIREVLLSVRPPVGDTGLTYRTETTHPN